MQAEMRIYATQYEIDIEDLQNKLQAIKMKMTAEIKAWQHSLTLASFTQ